MSVTPCGLFLSPNGILGASPDGVVGDSIVVEVKCPWRMRKSSAGDLCSDKTFFLIKNDDSFTVNSSHDYYHQIQGQIYLSGRKECHLVVWSPSEVVIAKVQKDDSWQDNLLKLSSFYCDTLLPILLDK